MRSVVTLELAGARWPDVVANVQVYVRAGSPPYKPPLMIPLNFNYDFHTVDVTFRSEGSLAAIGVHALAGVKLMVFFSGTIQAAEPVFVPT